MAKTTGSQQNTRPDASSNQGNSGSIGSGEAQGNSWHFDGKDSSSSANQTTESSGGGSSQNAMASGPSAAELEAARKAAESEAKRRQNDKNNAEAARDKQKNRSQNKSTTPSTISTESRESQADVANNASSVAPSLMVGDGTRGAAHVDFDSGEVVQQELTGRPSYFAPPTMPSDVVMPAEGEGAEGIPIGETIDPEDVKDDTYDLLTPTDEEVANETERLRVLQQQQQASQQQASQQQAGPQQAQQQQATNQNQAAQQQNQQQSNLTPNNSGSVFYNQQRRNEKKQKEETDKQRRRRERKEFNEHNAAVANSEETKKLFPNERRPFQEANTVDPNTTETQDINQEDIARNESRRAAELMQDAIKSGDLPAESRRISAMGTEEFDPSVEFAMAQVQRRYNCSRWAVKVLIRLRLGLGIDSKRKVFKKDYLKYTIEDSAIIRACSEILRSQQLNGHPLGLVDTAPIITGGTICFPIGVMPKQLAKELVGEGSVLSDISVSKLVTKAGKHWVNQTYPRIKMNLTGNAISQRYAIENMVRAICNLDGIEPEQFSVLSEIPRSFNEIMDVTERFANADQDNAEVWEYQLKNQSLQEQRLMRQRGRKPIKDETGAITGYEKRSMAYTISNAVATWMRFCGVAVNIPIIVSGLIEQGVGNFQTKALDYFFFKRYPEAQEYAPTAKMLEECKTQEGKDSVYAASLLFSAGGMDAIDVFSRLGYGMTTAEVNRFISDVTSGKDSNTPKLVRLAQQLSDIVVPGTYAFREGAARRFMENLMIAMSMEAKAGRPALTSEQIDEAMSRGFPQFMSQVMATTAGKEALITQKNLTMGRINPLSHAITSFLRQHGVTDALITAGLDTYVNYGVNLIQLLVPYSNTLSYLAVRGIDAAKRSITGKGADAMNYQMGANLDDRIFGEGMKKNFIYDTMKFGSTTLIAFVGFAIIQALGGLEDPPEELKYNYDEYLIGGKAIHQTWWMNDLTGLGWPFAVALSVFAKHPTEPDRYIGVFLDGCADMIGSASVIDAVRWIRDAKQNIDMIEESFNNPNFEKPDNWDSEAFKMMAWQFGFSVIGKSTPSIFKMQKDTMLPWIGEDYADRNPFIVFDREQNEDGSYTQNNDKTVSTTAEDAFMRRMSIQNGPLVGTLLNLTRNGYLFDDGTTAKTGYLFWEMPEAKEQDPVNMFFLETTRLDMDLVPQGSEEERQAYLEQHATNLIAYIEDNFVSPEQAIASGFRIEYEARINAKNFCYDQINKLNLKYIEECEQGMYPDYVSSRAASERTTGQVEYYYKLLHDYFNNDDLPWGSDSYTQLLSDTQQVYVWKDSGKPANAWDAFWNPNVETRYIPFGNHPTSFLPYTIRDDEDTVRNGEVQGSYYNENLTDPELLRNIGEANITPGQTTSSFANFVIPYGDNKGRNLDDVVFAGENGIPSSGLRAIRRSEDIAPDESSTLQSSADRLGIDLDDLNDRMDAIKSGKYSGSGSSKNYKAYTRYFGSGSSGSSYNPKIYSNPRSISADRAATMYTKQPYGPTISYLRPGFSTKGSREAYKRSDM